ncbi:ribbon-helix-helix protein, CopG family [Curtobacterium sp. MCBD17_003]|uniref:ribbon-helix-helix protein, CopG family n=1 Tax=Curtobacterium sp. MCBD17_003 TaxID=2175667 RepID=UPI000DAAA647|nr:ribbon-helix-helix protein, CopG family [Curtobacterium sp. MCBD17_003]WIE56337.1 ribbon-helix-helix protein, CopG family [Curtobacterium sp. MCBD17_003]
MVIQVNSNVARVTVALDPRDVDLLDRLSVLEGSNRSAVLRSLLAEVRPMLSQTVDAFERAQALRGELDRAAAEAFISDLQAVQGNVEAAGDQYLGAIAKLEGLAASDPRRSNHGGHTPTPPPSPSPEDDA